MKPQADNTYAMDLRLAPGHDRYVLASRPQALFPLLLWSTMVHTRIGLRPSPAPTICATKWTKRQSSTASPAEPGQQTRHALHSSRPCPAPIRQYLGTQPSTRTAREREPERSSFRTLRQTGPGSDLSICSPAPAA